MKILLPPHTTTFDTAFRQRCTLSHSLITVHTVVQYVNPEFVDTISAVSFLITFMGHSLDLARGNADVKVASQCLNCFISLSLSQKDVTAIDQKARVTYAMLLMNGGILSAKGTNLTLRALVPLSQVKAKVTDNKVMNNYFNLLDKTLDKYGLREKPDQIFKHG